MKMLITLLTLTALFNATAVLATSENSRPDCGEHLQQGRASTPEALAEGDVAETPSTEAPEEVVVE